MRVTRTCPVNVDALFWFCARQLRYSQITRDGKVDAPSRLYVFTALTQALTNVVRFAEVLIVWENQ